MDPLLMWRARNLFLHDRSHLMIPGYGAQSVTQQLLGCILFLFPLLIVAKDTETERFQLAGQTA